jgi:DNA-binding GntR family transcriptional regulator
MVEDHFQSLNTPASLQEQVYRQIAEKLVTGELRPSERLVLRKLSEAMGTSPMPVRDALQRLAALGVLVGKRTLCVPQLSTRELADIRDIRLMLEGLAVERAVQYASDASIAALADHYQKMRDAADQNDLHQFLRANAHFHLHIVNMAGSPILTGIIEPLWLRLGPAIKFTSQEQQHLHLILPVHRKLLEALIARDLKEARQALTEDILNSFGSLTDI